MLITSCSNTRFLADDELLYNGRQEVKITSGDKGTSDKTAEMHIKSVTSHKVNNALFDRRVLPPIGLWVYNYWKADKEKKVSYWMYKNLVGQPILISDVNPELRVKKIQNDLFDQGYFQSRVWSSIDTSKNNPRKARISYFVELPPPTRYNEIAFDTVKEAIDTLFNETNFGDQVKPGDQFNLNKLKTARARLSRHMQNNGFFYFNPDYIELNVDTTFEKYKMNLLVSRQSELPDQVTKTYKINDIHIKISRSVDSASVSADTSLYEDLTIISTGDYLRPEVLDQAIFFNKGQLYSYETHRNTLARLNNLGVFSFVRIYFEASASDTLSQKLDVIIDTRMLDNIGVDVGADMVMKSTGFLGPALSVGLSHGNAFRGAEKAQIVVNGGVEWQWGPKVENQLGSVAYDFGVSSGLTYPRFVLPGKNEKFKNIMNQETSLNLDLNLLNRTAYYTMFSGMIDLKYRWKRTPEIQHSISPLYLNSVSLIATTPDFDSIVDENIYIRKSFEEQFIIGTKYEFNYDNTHKIQPHNFFFLGSVRTSGNYIDLFASRGKDDADRPHYMLRNIYSQYVKITTDFRYYLNGFNKSFVFRLYAGLGIPYLNSTVIPYVEQFFSGGAYSVRGFTARTLGPGSYYEEDNTYIDQSGDVKLEGNFEYRFVLSKIVHGALFLEAGNIWLVNEDENRPGSQFHFSTFYNELAVGTGFGLRFDFNFFVLRTDVGFPLRTAYVTNDTNWLFGSEPLWKKSLFYIAIGYPF
jgi:hypothetical protein